MSPFFVGQVELEDCASRFIRLRPKPAAMGVDDGSADRQPHADSTRLRGVESLENALEVLLIDTWPTIMYCHENAAR